MRVGLAKSARVLANAATKTTCIGVEKSLTALGEGDYDKIRFCPLTPALSPKLFAA